MQYECALCGKPTKSFVTWRNRDYCVARCISQAKQQFQDEQDKLANTALCLSRGCSRHTQKDTGYCSRHQHGSDSSKSPKRLTDRVSRISKAKQKRQSKHNRRSYAKQVQRHFSAGCSRCGSNILLLGPSKAKPCLCSRCYISDRMSEDEALGLLVAPYAEVPIHYQEPHQLLSYAKVLEALCCTQYPPDSLGEKSDD